MSSPETHIGPNYFEVPPSPSQRPEKKPGIRVVKRGQQTKPLSKLPQTTIGPNQETYLPLTCWNCARRKKLSRRLIK